MSIKKYLQSQLSGLDGITNINKIQGEASTRSFFRITTTKYSLVAMVYPNENSEEIARIAKLTDVYKHHGLNVPEIKDIIDNRIILQEDLGDLLVQKAFSRYKKEEKMKALETVCVMLSRLKDIPVENTAAVLGTARMKWEMDFFVEHFATNFCSAGTDIDHLRNRLHAMVEEIGPIDTFAHRDFHSRNMLCYKDDIYLVDFQDSLRASAWYDLVSFAFDAYLDLKSLRKFLMQTLAKEDMVLDEEQFFLSALQRNIKALGTFGFQVTVRKNLSYKKYIDRTIRHIHSNSLFEKYVWATLFD